MAKNTAEKTKKKIGLSTQIFIALLIGALFGVVIHYWIPSSYIKDTVIVEGVLYVVGQGFIRLMQMLVVPLVFCSLICGSMAIGDTKTLGKVGVKTIGFYLKYHPEEPGTVHGERRYAADHRICPLCGYHAGKTGNQRFGCSKLLQPV